MYTILNNELFVLDAETASTHNSEAEKPSAESIPNVIAKKKIGTEEGKGQFYLVLKYFGLNKMFVL